MGGSAGKFVGGIADAVTGGVFDFSGAKKDEERAQKKALEAQEKMAKVQEEQLKIQQKESDDARKEAMNRTENIKKSFRRHYSSVSSVDEDEDGILG